MLFASKHVIALQIKRKILARAHHPSHRIRFKHHDRRTNESAEEAHPKVQTEASDRCLSRHVSHPRKRGPVEVYKPSSFRQALQDSPRPAVRFDRQGWSSDSTH